MYDIIRAMLVEATLSLRHLLTFAMTDHKALNHLGTSWIKRPLMV